MNESTANRFLGFLAMTLVVIAVAAASQRIVHAEACVPDATFCCWPPEAPFIDGAALGKCADTDCGSTGRRKCVNNQTPYAWFTNCQSICLEDPD